MPQITLADLRARVLTRIDNNTLLYPLVEIDSMINEALRLTNLALGYLQGQVEVPGGTQINRVFYDVPAPIVIPLRLQVEQTYLEQTGIEALGRSSPSWQTDSTVNTGYTISLWCPIGLRRFAIWPADVVGGNQLLMTGIMEPSLLVKSTDAVNWSKDVLAAFDLYATHVLQLKESPRLFGQASTDYNEFQKIIVRNTYLDGYKAPRYWVNTQPNEAR